MPLFASQTMPSVHALLTDPLREGMLVRDYRVPQPMSHRSHTPSDTMRLRQATVFLVRGVALTDSAQLRILGQWQSRVADAASLPNVHHVCYRHFRVDDESSHRSDPKRPPLCKRRVPRCNGACSRKHSPKPRGYTPNREQTQSHAGTQLRHLQISQVRHKPTLNRSKQRKHLSCAQYLRAAELYSLPLTR